MILSQAKKGIYASQFTSLCARKIPPVSAPPHCGMLAVTFRLQREDDLLTPRDLFDDSLGS